MSSISNAKRLAQAVLDRARQTASIIGCGPSYAWTAFVAKDKYRLVRPYGRNFKMYLRVGESGMMLERLLGRYESRKMQWLENNLMPGMTFVDVGVNKGDFSLFAAAILGGRGRVLSFEPEPENCQWIRKSIQANRFGDTIELFEVALADFTGNVALQLGTTSGAHSIVETCHARTGKSIVTATETLDNITASLSIPQIDMIKIDVEGAEVAVLAGARSILTRSPAVAVAVDVHPQYGVKPSQVIGILNDMGFSVDGHNSKLSAAKYDWNELYAYKNCPPPQVS